MLLYSGVKSQFDKDVLSGMIAHKIEGQFYKHGLFHNNKAEFLSWERSLQEMQRVELIRGLLFLPPWAIVARMQEVIAGSCYLLLRLFWRNIRI